MPFQIPENKMIGIIQYAKPHNASPRSSEISRGWRGSNNPAKGMQWQGRIRYSAADRGQPYLNFSEY